jgi:hypothetical protein
MSAILIVLIATVVRWAARRTHIIVVINGGRPVLPVLAVLAVVCLVVIGTL